ncbi:UDP-N-acetylmuramoyl-L-alanine--D-glutamate ligase [Halomonas sp. 18H]|uniref:UDP-N-acetylmuramoyl-L-alanine--D-glutamate ligase n=1 Tax=Halomonas almeriensis TaxID=308163 RepID=UPI002232B545|nr:MULTISPECIES: UDP-N-acetylmuramoyl-L-alanine--D-glutamate ligase [Halomonas]MCW4151661.1 UDP-N-acetylmuramoyl-L-alanine--D-glutamate ligase [Halomonas sp. 18H]MDN3552798.1 UDP-N-acetylmuramoyl-L-alanine--D-glutamate ligase [Halomonas almeriensis]
MVKVPEGVTLVVGLGVSGRAICRHLEGLGLAFMVADTRDAPPGLAAFRAAHPDIEVYCGALAGLDMAEARQIVVSPGVDPYQPELAVLAERPGPCGEPLVVGEMALFTRACKAPVAAITGSNAKSTVTTLLGEMAQAAGRRVAVGGNLGTPALDLLAEQPDADLYVLELSSFQLETTPSLGATTAAFLNLSEDHLDRHGNMEGYRRAKQAIFRGAQHAIVNAEQVATWPDAALPALERFTTSAPQPGEWGIRPGEDGHTWLMHGDVALLPTGAMRLQGRHHQANALATLAMGQRLGLPMPDMLRVVERFAGLAHRGEWVADIRGVRWINDSKGTNVGATLAAIAGIGPTLEGRLLLLAGGDGKGADFSPLASPLAQYGRRAIVFGQDAERLEDALKGALTTHRVKDLQDAMEEAFEQARPGDCVLLSPACASLDQFTDYQARGEAFRQTVRQWISKETP